MLVVVFIFPCFPYQEEYIKGRFNSWPYNDAIDQSSTTCWFRCYSFTYLLQPVIYLSHIIPKFRRALSLARFTVLPIVITEGRHFKKSSSNIDLSVPWRKNWNMEQVILYCLRYEMFTRNYYVYSLLSFWVVLICFNLFFYYHINLILFLWS